MNSGRSPISIVHSCCPQAAGNFFTFYAKSKILADISSVRVHSYIISLSFSYSILPASGTSAIIIRLDTARSRYTTPMCIYYHDSRRAHYIHDANNGNLFTRSSIFAGIKRTRGKREREYAARVHTRLRACTRARTCVYLYKMPEKLTNRAYIAAEPPPLFSRLMIRDRRRLRRIRLRERQTRRIEIHRRWCGFRRNRSYLFRPDALRFLLAAAP